MYYIRSVYPNNELKPFLFTFVVNIFVFISKMNSRHLLYPLLFLTIVACDDHHEYAVNDEFAPYILRFEQEAALRSKTFDLQKEGLIMTFANLEDDKAGICHYEKPIRIEIDREYWQLTASVMGTDLLRENLIFHELGHGFLDRRHTNAILENGDWKSMMCGGTKVDNRSWNINYSGLRRNYYVDELFNENTIPPSLMGNTLTADTSGLAPVISYTFTTNSREDTGWTLTSNPAYTITTDNGRLKFISNFTSPRVILLNISSPYISVNKDFSLEAEIECESTLTSNQYGIAFATSSNQNDTVEYFKINKLRKMYPGNSEWFGFYTELTKNSIQPTGPDKLKIVQINKMLYYFINNSYVYCTENGISSDGKNFGFIAPPNTNVYIDNFTIKVRKSAAAIAKAAAAISITPQIIELKEPNGYFPNK